MAFNYSGPGSSARDTIRFLIQDTDAEQPLLQDEEIDWLISKWGSRGGDYYVAARAAQNIAMKFAREVTFSSDSQHLTLSELMSKYTQMAEYLLAQDNASGVGTIYVGGVDGSGPRGPSFAIGMHDDPEAGYQHYDFGQRHPDQWGTSVP